MSERIVRPEGIGEEFWHTISEVERILAGMTTDEVPDVEGDSAFGGTVLDENIATDKEKEFAHAWLNKTMGEVVENLPVKRCLISADGKTRVVVYEKAVGKEEYYLSKWVNGGERPAYILWPWEMYEGQLDAGFEEEPR